MLLLTLLLLLLLSRKTAVNAHCCAICYNKIKEKCVVQIAYIIADIFVDMKYKYTSCDIGCIATLGWCVFLGQHETTFMWHFIWIATLCGVTEEDTFTRSQILALVTMSSSIHQHIFPFSPFLSLMLQLSAEHAVQSQNF